MVRKKTAKKRAYLQANNALYKKRREKIKEECWNTPEYAKRVATITRKIGIRNAFMKRIDVRNAKLMAIGNVVAIFMGINVRDIGKKYGNVHAARKNSPHHRDYIACCIFSKYCIENSIWPSYVSEYMWKPRHVASYLRRQFTKSWQKYPENREIYKNFKRYVEEMS